MPLVGPIPGYTEAVAAEHFDRLVSFFDVNHETICGIKVRPLTPRLALELDAAGSPFMRARLPETRGEIAAFVWHISTERATRPPWYWPWSADRWIEYRRRKFLRSLLPLDAVVLTDAIFKYVNDAGADGPGGVSGGGAPFACWPSTLVDYFASRYGWSENTILDLPLKRLWQYWRHIRNRESKELALFINRSDEVRGNWLAARNANRGN